MKSFNFQTAYWFVDGCPLMSAVCDAVLAANEEVFITDWWLSPEVFSKIEKECARFDIKSSSPQVYLKRGADFSPALRLDFLLRRKAVSEVA